MLGSGALGEGLIGRGPVSDAGLNGGLMTDSGETPHARSLLRRPGCWISFLTIIPVLIGGLYLVENWVGSRELARVTSEVAAAGIELDPRKIPSARPPDEENFCAVPLLLAIGGGTAPGPEMAVIKRMGEWQSMASKAGVRLQSARHPAVTPWAAWREAVVAADPAAGIEPGTSDPVKALSATLERELAAVFAELSAALPRPHSYLVPSYLDDLRERRNLYTGGRWINDLRSLASVCYLRATLAMEAGDAARAVESLRFLLRLAEGTESYGTAVAGLVGISIRSLALNAVWVAAERRQLPAPTWRELAAAFQTEQPLERLPERIQAEMIFSTQAFADFRKTPEQLWAGAGSSGPPGLPGTWQRFAAGFVPRGWFDANEATVLDIYLNLLRRTQDAGVLDRFNTKEWAQTWVGPQGFPWHNHVAQSLMSVMHSWVVPVASNHATCRLAEAACALEAYFLEHQAYPESLGGLVPEFLTAVPVDLDGRSIRYAPDAANGRYKLWSIGSDGVDDGGVEKAAGGATPRPWTEPLGDWVWQYSR